MTDYDLFAMINFRGMKHEINKVTHVIVVRQTREYINCLSLILGLRNYIKIVPWQYCKLPQYFKGAKSLTDTILYMRYSKSDENLWCPPKKTLVRNAENWVATCISSSINFFYQTNKKDMLPGVGVGGGGAVDLEGQCEISKPTALSWSLLLVAANPMFMIFLNSLFRVLFVKSSGLNVLAFWAIFLSKSAMLRLKLVCNKKKSNVFKTVGVHNQLWTKKIKSKGGGGYNPSLPLPPCSDANVIVTKIGGNN